MAMAMACFLALFLFGAFKDCSRPSSHENTKVKNRLNIESRFRFDEI